jgi:hypothetical protein
MLTEKRILVFQVCSGQDVCLFTPGGVLAGQEGANFAAYASQTSKYTAGLQASLADNITGMTLFEMYGD